MKLLELSDADVRALLDGLNISPEAAGATDSGSRLKLLRVALDKVQVTWQTTAAAPGAAAAVALL
jgi:hypothetical protein